MSGPVIKSETRNDFRIIQIWFNLAKYLAFTPLNVQSKKDRYCLVTKLYPLLLVLFYLGATVFSFYERYYIYKKFNISQAILDALQGLTEGVFIECVVLSSIFRRNRWRRLMRSITQLEQKVNLNVGDSKSKDRSLRSLTWSIVLYHLVYVTSHMYDSIINWNDICYSLAFVIFRFTTYYIMFSTFFVTVLCIWLKNRYLFLEQILKVSMFRKKCKFVFLEKEPECVYYDNSKEFTQHYKSLYLIVEEFNGIFGYQMFFISICTVLEILNAVNYGIPITPHGVLNDNTVVNILYSTLYVMCNARVVMACDSVEKCGIKIQKTCLILHENSETYEMKEEFYMLANYVEGLCPKFSAAGFWQVNQGVLSTLFSSVMTYLIIIIQFNITLQQ